ncbi:hypothetical protein BV22DRAFT_1051527 [Leucogyrophana mollusca]|uniref:Uncharacterized protein n=1 Tax=Leucogyrophana mollusca TaxID=85980 RepID=A0ACB8AZB4_9AGAM|nr:hypothetical protein BV22DRAFT_1051527 [Leucogyrophana mollusca]
MGSKALVNVSHKQVMKLSNPKVDLCIILSHQKVDKVTAVLLLKFEELVVQVKSNKFWRLHTNLKLKDCQIRFLWDFPGNSGRNHMCCALVRVSRNQCNKTIRKTKEEWFRRVEWVQNSEEAMWIGQA